MVQRLLPPVAPTLASLPVRTVDLALLQALSSPVSCRRRGLSTFSVTRLNRPMSTPGAVLSMVDYDDHFSIISVEVHR